MLKAKLTSGSIVVNAQYTVLSTDTLANAAEGLANNINVECGSSCFVQNAAASGAVIPLFSSSGSTMANLIALSVTSGTHITLTAASPNFQHGGTFDGSSASIIPTTSDVTIENTTFDSLYRGVQIPGKFGNETYSETQSSVTLSNDISVRGGDAFLYLPLLDTSASLSEIKEIGDIVKAGDYSNGLLFIDSATSSGGSVTDMLVQGGSCGATSYTPAPTCIYVKRSNAKLMGIDMSAVPTPVATRSPGSVTAIGNLGYP